MNKESKFQEFTPKLEGKIESPKPSKEISSNIQTLRTLVFLLLAWLATGCISPSPKHPDIDKNKKAEEQYQKALKEKKALLKKLTLELDLSRKEIQRLILLNLSDIRYVFAQLKEKNNDIESILMSDDFKDFCNTLYNFFDEKKGNVPAIENNKKVCNTEKYILRHPSAMWIVEIFKEQKNDKKVEKILDSYELVDLKNAIEGEYDIKLKTSDINSLVKILKNVSLKKLKEGIVELKKKAFKYPHQDSFYSVNY